jgi:DNA-binding transcriptional regulator YhcF (GntR family)
MIETLPGKGYFLKNNQTALTQQTRQRLLLTEIDEAVVMAHHLRVDRDKFLALVKERLDYFESKSSAVSDGK